MRILVKIIEIAKGFYTWFWEIFSGIKRPAKKVTPETDLHVNWPSPPKSTPVVSLPTFTTLQKLVAGEAFITREGKEFKIISEKK